MTHPSSALRASSKDKVSVSGVDTHRIRPIGAGMQTENHSHHLQEAIVGFKAIRQIQAKYTRRMRSLESILRPTTKVQKIKLKIQNLIHCIIRSNFELKKRSLELELEDIQYDHDLIEKLIQGCLKQDQEHEPRLTRRDVLVLKEQLKEYHRFCKFRDDMRGTILEAEQALAKSSFPEEQAFYLNQIKDLKDDRAMIQKIINHTPKTAVHLKELPVLFELFEQSRGMRWEIREGLLKASEKLRESKSKLFKKYYEIMIQDLNDDYEIIKEVLNKAIPTIEGFKNLNDNLVDYKEILKFRFQIADNWHKTELKLQATEIHWDKAYYKEKIIDLQDDYHSIRKSIQGFYEKFSNRPQLGSNARVFQDLLKMIKIIEELRSIRNQLRVKYRSALKTYYDKALTTQDKENYNRINSDLKKDCDFVRTLLTHIPENANKIEAFQKSLQYFMDIKESCDLVNQKILVCEKKIRRISNNNLQSGNIEFYKIEKSDLISDYNFLRSLFGLLIQEDDMLEALERNAVFWNKIYLEFKRLTDIRTSILRRITAIQNKLNKTASFGNGDADQINHEHLLRIQSDLKYNYKFLQEMIEKSKHKALAEPNRAKEIFYETRSFCLELKKTLTIRNAYTFKIKENELQKKTEQKSDEDLFFVRQSEQLDFDHYFIGCVIHKAIQDYLSESSQDIFNELRATIIKFGVLTKKRDEQHRSLRTLEQVCSLKARTVQTLSSRHREYQIKLELLQGVNACSRWQEIKKWYLEKKLFEISKDHQKAELEYQEGIQQKGISELRYQECLEACLRFAEECAIIIVKRPPVRSGLHQLEQAVVPSRKQKTLAGMISESSGKTWLQSLVLLPPLIAPLMPPSPSRVEIVSGSTCTEYSIKHKGVARDTTEGCLKNFLTATTLSSTLSMTQRMQAVEKAKVFLQRSALQLLSAQDSCDTSEGTHLKLKPFLTFLFK